MPRNAFQKGACQLELGHCLGQICLHAARSLLPFLAGSAELVPMIPREDRPLLEASQKRIVRVKDLPQRTLCRK